MQEQMMAPNTIEEKIPHKPLEPVIVHSPEYTPSHPYTMHEPRISTALDRRSVGSGIFAFREARASQQTLVDTSEAPVPRAFNNNDNDKAFLNKTVLDDITQKCKLQELACPQPGLPSVISVGHPYSVYCNECDVAMTDSHYHCSICDGGDYDICERCVSVGKVCPGQGHWLIKRSIKDGKIVSSTTERVQPRNSSLMLSESTNEKEVPGAFTEEVKTLVDEPRLVPTRTCNNCVVVLPERAFVTCKDCDDFDLCNPCHTKNKHGHHPAHSFEPAVQESKLSIAADRLLAPGRNVCHNAICDGCDKKIYGIRHKCLNCPDWDYCNDCAKDAQRTHPRHRFAPLYEPIANAQGCMVRHYGIYCDGPLCNNKDNQSYITGVRYKCAVCHDTDFCASCEALPGNSHNRTHPLVKIKTPIRGMSITTQDENPRRATRTMGDRLPAAALAETRSASTETVPLNQANVGTQAEMKAVPTFTAQQLAERFALSNENSNTQALTLTQNDIPSLLNAEYVSDSVHDGKIMEPGTRFTQIWTVSNPGPYVWPSECSVRWIGGDSMLNVDNVHPGRSSDIYAASESNVVGRLIMVGEQVAFKATMKAPMREGRYISYWRTHTADGKQFGHRLWADIVVKKAAQTTFTQASCPSPLLGAPSVGHTQGRGGNDALSDYQRQLASHMGRPMAQTVGAVPTDAPSRVAAMREQQAKRREQMMSQFNAHRVNLQARGINRNDMPGWMQHFNPVIGSSAQPTEDDKTRKEAARARVEHIKAKIMRARENKAKSEASAVEEMAVANLKTELENEKVKKIIEAVNREAEKEKTEDAETSQMIFPKLEKESPESSTYQSATSSSNKGKAAYVENEQGEVEQSATHVVAAPVPEIASPMVEKDLDDLEDDIEVLSAHGEDSEDDGFLTDEEYDILDASDQETVASL